jgi:Family of unknown function (DUF6171)
MTWEEALAAQIKKTSHTYYEKLCHESHKDHLKWRRRMIEKETGAAPVKVSLLQAGKNFISSAVQFAASGFKVLPDEDVKKRLDVCESCDQLTPDRRCSICRCFVDAKAKLPHESCPLRKWPGDDKSTECKPCAKAKQQA